MDEGRVPGAGSRSLQANGEVQEGRVLHVDSPKGTCWKVMRCDLNPSNEEDLSQKHPLQLIIIGVFL